MPKKIKRHLPSGLVHIKASFNNTLVTITDLQGHIIAWASSGSAGFKGTRKKTSFAGQLAAEKSNFKSTRIWLKKSGRLGERPRLRSRDCHSSLTNHRSKNPFHQGCHLSALQRVSPTTTEAYLSYDGFPCFYQQFPYQRDGLQRG